MALMNETAIESDEKTRILIVDDHTMFREALRKLIESQPGLTVVGEASNAREANEQLKILKPHIMLLDLSMPGEPGMEVLRRVTDAHLETHTVLLVAAIERNQITEALRLGAHGVLLKDTASQLLYRCIRAVMGGEYWIDKECVAYLVSRIRAVSESAREAAHLPKFGLTPRESEIISAVTNGYTNKEIAAESKISEQTVKHHLTSIFEKVGVTNRLELALFAMNHSLVGPD
jgi:DNA-binding NarL/FixJ family response regulator